MNVIKPYITNDYISVTKKGADPFTAPNTTNYMCATNFANALAVTSGDRRWCVLSSKWDTKQILDEWKLDNENYYKDTWEAVKNGVGEIKHYLETYDIPQWFLDSKVAPDTAGTINMINNARSEGEEVLDQAIDDFKSATINADIVDSSTLIKQAEASNDVFYEGLPNGRTIKNILSSRGLKHSIRIKYKGEHHRIYSTQAMTADELRELLEG